MVISPRFMTVVHFLQLYRGLRRLRFLLPIAVFTCLCGVQVLCSGHESLFARPAAEDPAGLRPAAWPPTGHCGPVRRKPVLRREVAAPAADDRGSGSATARGRRQTQLRCEARALVQRLVEAQSDATLEELCEQLS